MIDLGYIFALAALLCGIAGAIITVQGTLRVTMQGVAWKLYLGWFLIAISIALAFTAGKLL